MNAATPRPFVGLLRLLRVGTLFSPAADVAASAAMAGAPFDATLARAAAASVCLYAAGMAWNDIADRGVDRATYAGVVGRFLPWLRKAESWVGPHMPGLTSPLGERFIGLFGIPVAILLAAPIPFGNPPPAIALALLAIGILERDGRFVIAGYVAGLLSFVLVGALVWGLFGAGMAVLGG